MEVVTSMLRAPPPVYGAARAPRSFSSIVSAPRWHRLRHTRLGARWIARPTLPTVDGRNDDRKGGGLRGSCPSELARRFVCQRHSLCPQGLRFTGDFALEGRQVSAGTTVARIAADGFLTTHTTTIKTAASALGLLVCLASVLFESQRLRASSHRRKASPSSRAGRCSRPASTAFPLFLRDGASSNATSTASSPNRRGPARRVFVGPAGPVSSKKIRCRRLGIGSARSRAPAGREAAARHAPGVRCSHAGGRRVDGEARPETFDVICAGQPFGRGVDASFLATWRAAAARRSSTSRRC